MDIYFLICQPDIFNKKISEEAEEEARRRGQKVQSGQL